MHFDRFDIIEAHYAFCCEWHDGQFSDLYKRACKIRQYFKAGAMWGGSARLNENAREIYDQLVAKHKGINHVKP